MEEPTAEKAPAAAQVPFLQEKRILTTGAIVLAADQLTKQIVVRTIDPEAEVVVIEGFLKFVHWHNTGAAWSMFKDSSIPLAILSIVALGALISFRKQFEIHTRTGKLAMGMLMGGIMGNIIDRLVVTIKQGAEKIAEKEAQGSAWASGKMGDFLQDAFQWVVHTTRMGEGVVDFIRFHIIPRGQMSGPHNPGWPAFNIADMGICIGVGLMLVMAWKEKQEEEKTEEGKNKQS
mgnify:CR=1 FL=1